MFFVPLGLILMAFFMVVGLVKKMRGKEEKGRQGPGDISTEISH
jgi:hypothetical protein